MRKAQTVTVALPSGDSVTISPLWAFESDLVDEVYPRPIPPMVKDPNRGSLDPKIPNEADPDYQANLRKWFKNKQRAEIAIASSLPGSSKRWDAECLKLSCQTIAETYTQDEISLVWQRLRRLQTRELIADALRVIVAAKTDQPEDDEPGIEIPKEYDLTEKGVMMRAAERFGQDPFTWPDALSPEQRAQVIANEVVRHREEVEKTDALRAALAILDG